MRKIKILKVRYIYSNDDGDMPIVCGGLDWEEVTDERYIELKNAIDIFNNQRGSSYSYTGYYYHIVEHVSSLEESFLTDIQEALKLHQIETEKKKKREIVKKEREKRRQQEIVKNKKNKIESLKKQLEKLEADS